jgi:hypothetical protein
MKNYFVPRRAVVKNLDTSAFDCFRSFFKCKSKYNRYLYRRFEEVFNEKMEVMNWYKKFIDLKI